MDLIPLKSSNVAAAGWEDGRINVQFRDGAVYEGECSSEAFQGLMQAKSPGKYVQTVFPAGKLWKIQAGTPQERPAIQAEATASHMPDDCCGSPISQAISRGEMADRRQWFCPNCGASWMPDHSDAITMWSRGGAGFAVIRGRHAGN